MKYASLTLLSIFISHTALSSIIELNSNWTFVSRSNQEIPISSSSFLIHQLSQHECCVGYYSTKIKKNEFYKIYNNLIPTVLYIPSIGGVEKVEIGNKTFNFRNKVAVNEDLIIPIADSSPIGDEIKIRIFISSGPSYFAGFSRVGDSPILGDLNTITELKTIKNYHQNTLPLFSFVILLIFSLTFLLIHYTLRKRNPLYSRFSIALFSWALFYLFLSGFVRRNNFWFGSNFHFIARVFASYGTFLLLTRIASINQAKINIVRTIFIAIAFFQLCFGIAGYPVYQSYGYIAAAIIASFPILKARASPKSDVIGKLILILGTLAALGQTFDAIKLHQGLFGISISFPYLNRFTFVPLLLVSFGDCIIQFSSSFHQLRSHLFKAKSYAKTILHSAKEGLSHENVDYFLKVTGKICGYNRVSLAQRHDDGSYSVIKLYGSKFPAEGAIIDRNKNPQIESAICDGKIIFGTVKYIGETWKTSAFTAVPVPEKKQPPYLLLLSDPKKSNLNTKDIVPYLSQISSAIWTNLSRTKEQSLRVQSEKKFSALVQRLDPNLYSFITDNLDRLDDPNRINSDVRGIIFFDQSAYSTMTENYDNASMGRFTQIIGEWVSKSAVRFGARISNFAGDAFLLETYGIGSELEHSIALRTLNLVWTLASTLGDLNQILIKEGFSPVMYRFGAHIGHVTAANLDFIQKGLSNSIGDTVNIAARLQSIAKAGTILITGELSRYTSGKFIIAEVPRAYVKGRSKTIEIFSLIGKVDDSQKVEAKVA